VGRGSLPTFLRRRNHRLDKRRRNHRLDKRRRNHRLDKRRRNHRLDKRRRNHRLDKRRRNHRLDKRRRNHRLDKRRRNHRLDKRRRNHRLDKRRRNHRPEFLFSPLKCALSVVMEIARLTQHATRKPRPVLPSSHAPAINLVKLPALVRVLASLVAASPSRSRKWIILQPLQPSSSPELSIASIAQYFACQLRPIL
jgi:hypothetical protein